MGQCSDQKNETTKALARAILVAWCGSADPGGDGLPTTGPGKSIAYAFDLAEMFEEEAERREARAELAARLGAATVDPTTDSSSADGASS